MKQILYITFFVFAFQLTSCGENASKTESGSESEVTSDDSVIQITKEQFNDSRMELGTLSEQSFPKIVQTTGMIDVPPSNKAIISSFAGGYVKNSNLLIGDKVKKGQVLATLENPEFVEIQQEYLESAQKLKYLKSEYNRQKTLVEEQISSQKNFLKAESDYKSTLAIYNGLKKKLQMLNINIQNVEAGKMSSIITLYAPIHGSITRLNVSKGTFVSPADEIMEIINTDHVHVELSVFEKDILKVKEGQRIMFKVPEAVEQTYEAEVHLVGTSIDPKNRTVKVHGHLANDENNNFAVGMFVDAQIITESISGTAIPEDAIITIDDKQYVLLKKSDENEQLGFKQQEVETGSTFNGFTMLKNENLFSKNDSFLIKGGFSLLGE
ncbi:efflux RND transporter periplasmic adaptor subunit [Maribacter sp. HTCC2170]|uniref:efflux RND transporter periplasmic adaptor subunit n=1 Tax=Maribacter sp. (strain HTCC2170 / KCCM 42371) TaxID=313603 RepID=UPI0002EDA6DA|nr:efflux RND transporter periplasmic adaptor subunit [Maribacter sp. HTCC2170]